MLITNDEASRSAMRRMLDYLEQPHRQGEVIHLAMEAGELHLTSVHPDAYEFFGEDCESGPCAIFNVSKARGGA